MKCHKVVYRVFSVFLLASIVFLGIDFPVAAENQTTTIIEFESLEDTTITFDEGTDKETVINELPDTLNAKVEIYTETPVQVSGGGITSAASSEIPDRPVSVSVTWDCLDFNANEAGDYIFIAAAATKEYKCDPSLYPSLTVSLLKIDEIENPGKDSNQKPIVNTRPSTDTSDAHKEQADSASSNDSTGNSATTDKPEVDSTADADKATHDEAKTDNASSASQTQTSGSSSNNSLTNSSNNASASASAGNSSANDNIGSSRAVASLTTPAVQEAAVNTDDTVSEENKQDIPVKITQKTETKSEFSVGEGKAVINLEKSKATDISAIITDDETLLKNILTDEQLKKVAEGSTANLKVSVDVVNEADIDSKSSEAIKKGFEKYKEEIPGLDIAGYIDVSIYLQMDDEDWTYVSNTNKPVELVINVPESMKGLSQNYYLLRLHDGETTLFADKDDEPDTITISTGKFSIYVIMYDSEAVADIEKTEKKEMSLLTVFVIVLIAVLLLQIIYIFGIRKKLHSAEQQ